MKKEIIELAKDCKLVRERSIQNGHDCWGNLEWYTELYVFINGREEYCPDKWLVIHDGKNVIEILPEELLQSREKRKKYKKETGFNTPSEYKAYLKGLQEGKRKV